jgi:hypothetical protein
MSTKDAPLPPLGRTKKSPALIALERMANQAARRDHPNVDPKYLAPRLFQDNDTGRLTTAVIEFLRLSGHQCERIHTTGRVIDKTKTFRDVTGRTRKIGSMTWIPTTGTRGSADISATIYGLSVKIEIKQGRDSQSEVQKEYQRAVETAGGYYVVVWSFQDFFDWYNREFAR